MINQIPTTPKRGIVPGCNSPAMERVLILNDRRRKAKRSLMWGCINMCLFAIVLYDIMYTCPLYISYLQYFECTLTVIFFLNSLYHCVCYAKTSLRNEPIEVTPTQKKLLGIDDADPNFTVVPEQTKTFLSNSFGTPTMCMSTTPMDITAHSWQSNISSNISQNNSLNYSMSSPSWIYSNGSPRQMQSPDFIQSPLVTTSPAPYRDTSGINFISDKSSLNQYLKAYETYEKTSNIASPTEQPTNLLSSFWSHSATKSNDVSPYLKKCQYQLSSQSPVVEKPKPDQILIRPVTIPSHFFDIYPDPYALLYYASSHSPTMKTDDCGSPRNGQLQNMEIWRRLNIDSGTLTQWNANLRMWISQTIFERLIKEFNHIDDSLQKHGLSDIRIGEVGLDRLRKTAQTAPVSQFIPSLSVIIQFLEVTSNQQYLVKRIRELSKGGCMSEFTWNGGSSFNGKEWDDSLPTDCAIIMHLLATYLDTQLMPLPTKPDAKPFSHFHFIKHTEKLVTLGSNAIIIHQLSEKPPHYQVLVGEETYTFTRGYNNLFQCIFLFLYYVNERDHGMLGRVNLGRSGINMLWIIQC